MSRRYRDAGLMAVGVLIAVGVACASLYREGHWYRTEVVLWARQARSEEVCLWDKKDDRRLETKAHMAALREMAGSAAVWAEAARWSEEPAQAMRSAVKVSIVPDSEMLQVQAEARSPWEARRRAAAMARAVVCGHITASEKRAREALRFIESQLFLAQSEWRAAGRESAEFRKKHGLLSEEGKTQQLLGRLSALETQLADARADEDRLARQCQVSERLMLQEPPMRIASSMVAENPALAPIKGELGTLEAQLASYRTRRTDAHPESVALDARVQSLRSRLAAEEAQASLTETTAPNPVREEIAIRCALLHADREGAEARRLRLEAEIELVRREIAALPEAVQRLKWLEVRSRTAEEIYRLLATKREESALRVQEAASRPQIQIISEPVNALPVDSRPALRVALAAMLGLASGWSLLRLKNGPETSSETKGKGISCTTPEA
ncbi:MAG: hypothetical protein IT210_01130 [Armatimonadetes bacterium]|nr:hypothetical protein [Armatimonadota bacterium]